ncbi:DUF1428 domain-containing protein [Tabrizicola piscis]|uniref:DUF1428 domain-containing protein n=1 Tax=Tabrizicola piscis TaxID=2494374 RepID=A0A3S8U2E3_9RHOB|nr:DUF1428 family protein [Tabrizicola piscis]AZL57736.1 DUF1428 domain-containing protein [Tabrizicola piscis]
MNYIDGFLIPVRTTDRETYRDHEAHWWPSFQKHGALSIVVGWGDDVPAGKQTDFRRAVDLLDDETVVFCWMTWPDKETRNKAYAALESEMTEGVEMPFDGKRMVYGGFVPILQEG